MRTALCIVGGLAALVTTVVPAGTSAATPGVVTGHSFVSIVPSPSASWEGLGTTTFVATKQVPFDAQGGANPGAVVVSQSLPYSGISFQVEFAVANGGPLQKGNYSGLQRYGFQSKGHGGLDVSLDSQACDTVTGRAKVLDVAYSPSGELSRLRMLFEEHCVERPTPALFGEVSINEPLVAVQPVPDAVRWPLGYPGARGMSVPILMTNTARSPARVRSVAVTGPNRRQFRIGTNRCLDATIPPGGVCRVNIRDVPTSFAEKAARLRIAGPGLKSRPVRLYDAAYRQHTVFQTKDDPSDPMIVGTQTVTPRVSSFAITGDTSGVEVDIGRGRYGSFTILFPAPAHERLRAGHTYPFTGTYSYGSVVSNLDCPHYISGSFTVDQATFGPAIFPKVKDFAATFIQRCDGTVLRGTIAYRAPKLVKSVPRTQPSPGSVREVTATAIHDGVRLHWLQPRSSNPQDTMIRMLRGTKAPSGPNQGMEVSDGHRTSAVITGIRRHRTYSFSLFARDAEGHAGPPVHITV